MEKPKYQPEDFELLEIEADDCLVSDIMVQLYFEHAPEPFTDPGLRLILNEDRPPVDLTHHDTEVCVVRKPAFRCFIHRYSQGNPKFLASTNEELIDILVEKEFTITKMKRPKDLAFDLYCKFITHGFIKSLEG